jgi:hypothetical protein
VIGALFIYVRSDFGAQDAVEQRAIASRRRKGPVRKAAPDRAPHVAQARQS